MKRFTNTDVLLDSLKEGVFLFDNDGGIVFWNKAAVKLLGFSKQEMLGKSVYIIFRGWTFPWERDPELLAYPVSEFGEIMAVEDKAGGEKMLAIESSPQYDADGKFVGGIGTFHDVTMKLEEMALAQRIQATMINNQPDGEGFALDVYFHPEGIVGGDFFKMHKLAGREYSLFYGDFTGHGIVGAMYTVMMDKHLSELRHKLADPLQVAEQLNGDLSKLLAPGYFCTAVVGRLDADTGVFTFVQAGSPPLIHVHSDGTFNSHRSTSPPLGLFAEARFALSHLTLGAGDSLFFFSDGLFEAPNPEGKMIGLRGVNQVLRRTAAEKSDWRAREIYTEVKHSYPKYKLRDDILLVKLTKGS